MPREVRHAMTDDLWIATSERFWSVVVQRHVLCAKPFVMAMRWILGSALWLVLSTWSVEAANLADETPLELRPYRVQLCIAFDGSISKQAGSAALESTRSAAQRCLGTCWDLTVTEATWLQPVSAEALSRLSAADLASQMKQDPGDLDVWQVAGIRPSGAGFRIEVRSWQPTIGIESAVTGADVYDSRDVPLTLLELCHASFRPIGVIDDVDGKQARVLLQAGAISVPDPKFSLNRHARLFVPVLASRNKDKKIERWQTVPWTYLSAGESQGVRVQCDLHSGLRSPIGGKQRGRVVTLAVAVQPTHPATLLEVATQSKLSLPLVAHRIELRDSPDIPPADAPADQDEHLLQVLLTDRRGQVKVPAEAGSLVWLFAYSGRHLLARVPMIPGMSERMRLEVPDDSARLAAESDLYTLQGQLIEAVAARTTSIARIRAAIKKNDLKQAKAAEAELRKLPASEVYLEKVTVIRVPAVKAAKSRRDRAGEARINRMCDEMSELIKQHLSEDKRQVVLEELKELYTDDTVIEKSLPDDTKKPAE